MTPFEQAVHFFFQLAVLLTTCRLVGRLVRPLGQPQVVAEMIAGVLLGPSLLGLLAPELQAWLFPRSSIPILYVFAQLGLALYMFLVGLEFDLDRLRARAKSALYVGWAGIAVPFAGGAALALGLDDRCGLFAPAARPFERALFLGAAISITAFPMLARILYERGIAKTSMGTLALTAGSTNDAAAWALLAVVLASFGGDRSRAGLALGGGLAYGVLMLTLGRRALAGLFERVAARDEGQVLPVALVLLALAAWLTDTIGIYAVFGAFVLGAAMPKGRVSEAIERRSATLTTDLLLPFFFVYSGLNTRLDLLASGGAALAAAAILLVSFAGKGGACALAARAAGERWRAALAIGALMNARGLMELILLNLGLEHGVITPTLFSILVLMAVVTTLAAGPAFQALYGDAPPAGRAEEAGDEHPARSA
jgi:Kef-type K+ transport system membrane component KefB